MGPLKLIDLQIPFVSLPVFTMPLVSSLHTVDERLWDIESIKLTFQENSQAGLVKARPITGTQNCQPRNSSTQKILKSARKYIFSGIFGRFSVSSEFFPRNLGWGPGEDFFGFFEELQGSGF